MEDFVQKIYDFIMFMVNTIKDLVASLTGETTDTTDDTKTEGSGGEQTVG